MKLGRIVQRPVWQVLLFGSLLFFVPLTGNMLAIQSDGMKKKY
jgi:hypothetical protein